MPTTYSPERRVDTKALEAHLRSRGLTPASSKWFEVWHRKKRRFMYFV